MGFVDSDLFRINHGADDVGVTLVLVFQSQDWNTIGLLQTKFGRNLMQLLTIFGETAMIFN